MLKTLCFIFVSLLLVSCQKSVRAVAPIEQTDKVSTTLAAPVAVKSESSLDNDVPSAAHSWDAEVYYVNFSSEDQAKVEKAIVLMKKVIASPEFKNAVINHTYNGKKGYVDSNGLSNEQIYQKILDGAEEMGNTSKNNTLDVELELYFQATTTIGYTYPDTTRIWMNKKYFDKYTPVNVSGNLMHEWLHKLGFGHAMTYSQSRDSSVPYAIGYMMERMAKNI